MEKETLLSSNRLFHYTSSKENLIKILENGFKPRYSLEKLNIIRKDELLELLVKEISKEFEDEKITDEFAIPMCCFCDIPLNLVDSHRKVYGDYAIGIKKEWGEKNAICPVMYIPEKGESRFLFELMIRFTHRILPKIRKRNQEIKRLPLRLKRIEDELTNYELTKYIDTVINLIMYIKPYKGFYERKYNNFKDEHYKFYDEREWRYKPNSFLTRSFLTAEDFQDKDLMELFDDEMGYLDFNIDDITDIIVPENEVNTFKELVSKIERLKGFDIDKIITFRSIIGNN